MLLREVGVEAVFAYCDPCSHLDGTYFAPIFDSASVGDRGNGLVDHNLEETPVAEL